jgi:hypothetical protein
MSSTSTIDLANAIQNLNAADRGLLLAKLQEAGASEMKASAEKVRLASIRAAANDPARAVAFKSSLCGLARLNLDLDRLAAAADPLAELNRALDSAKWTFNERIQLKTSLAGIGAID